MAERSLRSRSVGNAGSPSPRKILDGATPSKRRRRLQGIEDAPELRPRKIRFGEEEAGGSAAEVNPPAAQQEEQKKSETEPAGAAKKNSGEPAKKNSAEPTPKKASKEQVPVEAMEMAMQILRRRLCDMQAAPVLPCLEENQRKLSDLLKDTIVQACNNSALLLGPRGCGKSMVLERSLKEMQRVYVDRVSVVRLNGLVHADGRCALKEIANQLCTQHTLDFSKTASFTENLEFLTIILEELSRSQRALVIVLDEFDLFAQKPKQSLLYNLLNLMQSASSQAAIVGISCRLDADQLLEKRVRSRFSQRKILFLPPSPEEITSFLETMLQVPVSSSGEFAHYAQAFNKKTLALLQKESTKDLVRQLTAVELSPRHIIDVIFRRVCDVSETTSAALTRSPTVCTLGDLSVLELCLLVAMKRLEDKECETYNFNSVFKEYQLLKEGHKSSDDSYTKQAASKAFEHLLDRELIEYVEGKTQGGIISQRRAVKLLISYEELQEGLETSPVCPTMLRQWFK